MPVDGGVLGQPGHGHGVPHGRGHCAVTGVGDHGGRVQETLGVGDECDNGGVARHAHPLGHSEPECSVSCRAWWSKCRVGNR